jgi:O-antigen ligase
MADAGASEASASASAPALARAPSRAAAPVFALILLALIAHAPQTLRPSLVGRAGVLLIGTAVGLPLLARLAAAGDRTARWGCGFVLWAALSATVAGTGLAWTGAFFSLTGALYVLALGAFWAIGRVLPEDALPAVATALLVGAGVNAAIAVLQSFTALDAYDIALYDQRATGLMGNPVFLGTLCASAIALVPTVVRRRPVLAAAATALLAAAAQLSGTRNALAVLVAVTLWAAVRSGRARGALVVAAAAAGLALGTFAHPQVGETAVARLQGPSGVAMRVENWREGLVAVRSRPVFGYGPGRFGTAVSPHRTLRVAREGPDRLYEDAHNLFVEHLVTLGVVGLGLLVVWLGSTARLLRRSRAPELVVFAGALLVNHLVEPQQLVLTPLMLLAAAAALPRHRAALPHGRAGGAATGVLAAIALLMAGTLVLGDVTYRGADLDFDLAGARRASTLLWPWARPVTLLTRIHLYQARTQKDPHEISLALATAREARAREPQEPKGWIAVAAIEAQLDRHADAARDFAGALRLNPWSEQALSGRADALDALGRPAQADACRAATRLRTRSGSALRRSRSACVGETNA